VLYSAAGLELCDHIRGIIGQIGEGQMSS